MDTQMHVNIAAQGSKKTPNSAKPRRASYYKKKGRQGRRTKLTGSLLTAITEIIAETEILSISHLSQELLARGHSLSRSTVFRAMEVLGLRVDRDRKVWCAGPGRLEAGPGPQCGASKTTDGITKLTNSTSAHTDSFSGRPKHPPILISYPRFPSSNIQRTDNPMSSGDIEIADEKSDLYIATQNQYSHSNQESDDNLSLVSQEFELTQCTGSQGSMRLTDDWTESTKVRDGLRQVNVTSSAPAQRRGRKRKSDCPAKFGAFHKSQGNGAETSNWSSTAPPTSNNGHAVGNLKGSNSTEPHSPKTLPISGNLQVGNHWKPVPPKSSVKAGESSTPSTEGYGYEIKDQKQLQSIGLQEKPAAQLRREELPTSFKRAKSPEFSRPILTQSPPRGSMSSDPEVCGNGTLVSGKNDSRTRCNGVEPELNRAVLDHEVAGYIEWNESKFVLRDRRLIGTTLKDDQVPVTSSNLQVGGADFPRHRSASQTQRRQQSSSPQLPRDAQKEGTHKDAGQQLEQQSSVEYGVLNLSSNGKHAKTAVEADHQSHNEQHLGRQSWKGGHLLTSNGNSSTVNSTIQGYHRIPFAKCKGRETDFQTARLHALTSSLAAKTSKVLEATSQDLRIKTRGATDGKHSPVLYSSVNPEHYPISICAEREPRSAQTRQRAVSKSSVASASPQTESIQSNQNAYGAVNPPASSDMNAFSMFLPELKSWMQEVSNRLNSMENQLQHLTQIITQPPETTQEAEHKELSDEEETGDGEAEETDEEDEGNADEDKEEEEEDKDGELEVQKWDTALPPFGTPDSNDMIDKLLSDERWNSFSPYVGGPRLAIRLARDCIFGSKVLSKSTVTGRNGMKPLQRDGVKKIKDCLMQVYGPRCSEVECEILWKMARESLSQLCKRTRRQIAAEGNDNDTDDQD